MIPFRTLLSALVLLLVALNRPALGQTLPSGPQVLTFFSDVDDADQPYALYLPKNFDASKRYPLVVSLHGAGSNHRLNLRRVFGKSNAEGENDVEYTEYPGVGHDSWVNAYANEAIFDWFGQFRRNPFPDSVRFASSRYAYDHAYWVQLDALTPGTTATIGAYFAGPNRLAVTTSALDGFTLHLAGHPRFAAGEPLAVTIDGAAVDAPGADSLSFSRRGGAWVAQPYEAPATAKRAGAEGPMSAVLAGRHVYVYGTEGDASEEEVAARRAIAEKAAAWSVYRGPFLGRVMVFPRVAADREVRPSDLESANLVLFGTKETNSLIDRFSDTLPLQLDDAATDDYGLVYAYPVGEHYALVNEGLPWWQAGADGNAAWSFSRGFPAFALPGQWDYVLFKGSADQVVAAGRFNQAWRLPPSDAEKLRAAGVTVATDRAVPASAP